MAANKLADHLAALVHHVELSKGGWRERALDFIVLTTCFWAGTQISKDELLGQLNHQLQAPVGRAQLEAIIERLSARGSIIEQGQGLCKISESERQQLEANFDQAGALDDELRVRFCGSFSSLHEKGSPSWESFKDDFLYPLVDELGAKTYEVLSANTDASSTAPSYANYLGRFPKPLRGTIGEGLSTFFDPTSPAVRRFVLNRLNATFLVRATALSEPALKAIAEATQRRLQMKVFVDTNFLFSLLGLHENPADDVVEALESLIQRTGGNTDVKLYVLPTTLDEARFTIGQKKLALSGIILDRHLARSIMHGTADMSGIILKYIRECAAAGGRLGADEYFEPYLENLVEVCRSKRVEVYNKNLEYLQQDQGVVDDLLREREHQAQFRAKGPKPYPVLRHDMVLWHFVSRQRAVGVESVVDAGFWIATLDFGLLAFDRQKRGRDGGPLPVTIHPTVLLQILQFWVPQSTELEIALVNSLHPMLPHESDPSSEVVSLKILKVLSRFANVNDLGPETVGKIFVDRALRARVKETDDLEAQIQLVESAIIEETRELRASAERWRGDRQQWDEREKRFREELASRGEELRARDEEIVNLRRESARSSEAAEKATSIAEAERERAVALEARIEGVEASTAASERARVALKQRRWFTVSVAVTVSGLCWLALEQLEPFLRERGSFPFPVPRLLSIVLAVAGGIALIDFIGGRLAHVREWIPYLVLRRIRRWLWTVLSVAAIGVVASFLSKWLGL